MNRLIGNGPRHPGLWLDHENQYSNQLRSSTISTVATHTHGRDELRQVSAQLATLSLQGQWIVLISPPNIGYKQVLAEAGVRMNRVLLVHAKDEVETLWAMEKALTSGTSSAVLCWTQSLDARDSRRLQIVAKSARALGIVIEDANAGLQIEAHNHVLDSTIKPSLFGSVH
ncbi:cell division protein [Shewanella sp. D64]|uniref:cell division inhibitor SulA n=1 Tax=unclassified Shewanella TaxID=196818 RepID=UPI0022BA3949|nr:MULTISPECIES: SulA-like leucine-rich domain-containing protein [unclassified Shewanella]MEC4727949.1 cell division protein [Shewanella sp. D64]MEC4740079.1 cell division protein [Shewanella sp. E94]WBJ95848.1 cell division protein [Shewanella sp. MTB7]